MNLKFGLLRFLKPGCIDPFPNETYCRQYDCNVSHGCDSGHVIMTIVYLCMPAISVSCESSVQQEQWPIVTHAHTRPRRLSLY